MKIATNVARDCFGGITTSNLALFDALNHEKDLVVGIELTTRRAFDGASLFWKYPPHFFHHRIVNCFDLMSPYLVQKKDTYGSVKRRWKPVIDHIASTLKREAPEVLLLNGTFFAPWAVALAAKKVGVSVVLRYAGVLQRETTHYPDHIRKIFLRMEREIVSLSSQIVFPSDLCRQVVQKEIVRGRLPEWSIIPNPVSLPSPAPRRPRGKSRDIAVVGRWVPIKNFEAFVDVHKALNKSAWEHRAFIVTTSTKLKGIPRSIQRIPPMGHAELFRFYASLGLLMMPSHFETFGNVAAEALACGTPVLVSKNTGFAEILIKAGLENMVTDFSDIAAATEKVKLMCGKKVPAEKLATVLHLLDKDINRDHLLAILREAAKDVPVDDAV